MTRPLVAEINLSALRRNYQLACQQLPQGKSVAVLKANAYGHGAVQVAQALQDLAPAFALACLEEALELRQAGIQQPLVLLGGFFTPDELPIIAQQGCQPAIYSAWQLEALAKYFSQPASLKNPALTLWLKIDTGMHRLGFPLEEVEAALAQLRSFKQVKEVILISHLAQADLLTADEPCALSLQQLARIQQLSRKFNCRFSLTNSAASLTQLTSEQAIQRLGISLYGLSPFSDVQPNKYQSLLSQLEPVMTLKTQLISVRDLPAGEAVGYGGRYITRQPSRIGVAACGYGDGYPRQMRDGAPLLVGEQLASLAGRVSMDLITLDLTACPAAKIGDQVIIWGKSPMATDVASYCDTISYTLVTGLLPRVKRVYLT